MLVDPARCVVVDCYLYRLQLVILCWKEMAMTVISFSSASRAQEIAMIVNSVNSDFFLLVFFN